MNKNKLKQGLAEQSTINMNMQVTNQSEQSGPSLKAIKLPSFKQPGDHCRLEFGEGMNAENCQVIEVSFTRNKVFYDVEAFIYAKGDVNCEGPYRRIRYYHVDSEFVK